jgi:hypothetical protein
MQSLRYGAILLAFCLAVPGEAAAQRCHPSYEGACVPIASDVDCAGGKGNGPEYVRGPIYVVGPDEYELDRDGDGIACEPEKTRR